MRHTIHVHVASRIGEFRCRSFPSQTGAFYSTKIISADSTAFELVGSVIVDNQTTVAIRDRSVHVYICTLCVGVEAAIKERVLEYMYVFPILHVFKIHQFGPS